MICTYSIRVTVVGISCTKPVVIYGVLFETVVGARSQLGFHSLLGLGSQNQKLGFDLSQVLEIEKKTTFVFFDHESLCHRCALRLGGSLFWWCCPCGKCGW